MVSLMNYLTGLLFIGIGFLVVKYPMLIAGYNTMPKKEREKIDIQGLSRFMRSWFIGMGLATILGSFLFPKIGLGHLIPVYMFTIVLGGCFLMTIIANIRGYTKNGSVSKPSKTACWIISVILSVTFISIAFTLLPADVKLESQGLKITGAYPVSLNWKEIDSLQVRETLPAILLRTNGASFWKWHKGHYKVEEWGRARLYLQSLEGPFLVIYSSSQPVIVINRKDKKALYSLYQQIRENAGFN